MAFKENKGRNAELNKGQGFASYDCQGRRENVNVVTNTIIIY
jgi:hypothetical protein